MTASFRKFALVLAAALGCAQAAGSATQTIAFRVTPFSRAQLSAPVAAPAGQAESQAASTLQLASTGDDLRVLVRSEQALPPGVSLTVRAAGADLTLLGATDTDLGLPTGPRPAALDLRYDLRGALPGADLRVVYTILER